jgi:hypothetical protein
MFWLHSATFQSDPRNPLDRRLGRTQRRYEHTAKEQDIATGGNCATTTRSRSPLSGVYTDWLRSAPKVQNKPHYKTSCY